MVRSLIVLLLVLPASAQEAPADVAAKAALEKLSGKFKELRTLSAKVTQIRRTELLDKPLTSSGTMYYRREPARLVFRLTEPKRTEIHMDKTTYQVYRPDEKRLERTEFSGEDVSGRILMVFEPKSDEIGKAFTVHGGASRDGVLEVRLEPSDDKVRKRLQKVQLDIVESDGTLRRIVYVDGDGDEVRFDLADVALNPELPAGLFSLDVPEGTRILRHTVTLDK